MRKELVLNVLRKAAICLLLASALFLLFQTDYFFDYRAVFRRNGEDTGAGQKDDTVSDGAASLSPVAVMVRPAGGTPAASAYDGEATEQAFRRFSAVFGEALGSAGGPEAISETAFRAELDKGGVCVLLGWNAPLSVLSDWLGAGGGGAAGMEADLLCLCLDGEEVSFCFRTTEGFYRCATASTSETLSARMLDFHAAGAEFAYEDSALSGVAPYTVVLDKLPDLPVVRGESAGNQLDAQLLTDAVGMNSYVTTSYYDADGTLVLMEGMRTLRLNPNGMLYYRDIDREEAFQPDDLVAAVNHACRLMRRAVSETAGDARLSCVGVETTEAGFTVMFDYVVNGVPVRLSGGGHAGSVMVSGGVVRWASLSLRRYTVLAESEIVLPMPMAAAMSVSAGGKPALIYADYGELMHCVWVND